MSFAILDINDQTLLTGTTPLAMTSGTYYLKRCKVDSVSRKVTIDSSPGVDGSFAQDFGDHSWMITGGTLMIVSTSEMLVRTQFATYAPLIKQQIGLTLIIPNEKNTAGNPDNQTYTNCVCTAFELMRRPHPDLRTVIPNGDGSTYRAYVAMEFVQLSK